MLINHLIIAGKFSWLQESPFANAVRPKLPPRLTRTQRPSLNAPEVQPGKPSQQIEDEFTPKVACTAVCLSYAPILPFVVACRSSASDFVQHIATEGNQRSPPHPIPSHPTSTGAQGSASVQHGVPAPEYQRGASWCRPSCFRQWRHSDRLELRHRLGLKPK